MMRRRWAISAVMAAGLLALPACSSESGTSEAQFARVSAEVIVADDDVVAANLVVAAPSDDSIWSGVDELVVRNELPGNGDLVFGKGEAELIPGGEQHGVRVGTLVVQMPQDFERFAMSNVVMILSGSEEPRTYEIGEWSFERRGEESIVSVSGEYPASVSECSSVSFDVKSDASYVIEDVTASGDGVAVIGVKAGDEIGASRTVELDLACDSQYDLFAFTPLVTVKSGEKKSVQPLPPILVGYLDLSAETVDRVLQRQ